jgi:hypothetical protein
MEPEPQPEADRWHRILQWLEEHRVEICQTVKGHIRIDYAGEDGLSFEISRKETNNGR